MSRHLSVWLLCIVSLLCSSKAEAVDRQWNQATGGHLFDDANNWNPAGVPLAGDNVVFGLDGDVDVSLGSPSVANDVAFTDGVVEFTGAGGAMLNIGGIITIDDVLATGLADGAHVTLNGGDWNSSGDVRVGAAGYGTLNLQGEGTNIEAESLFVGSAGTGDVTIGAGALVEANTVQLGKEGSGSAHVLITGAANAAPSTLRVNGRLDLGDPDDNPSASAVLDIAAGGLVTVGDSFYFGSHNLQSVHVTDIGSSLQVAGTSYIGNGSGTGTLNITGGARATATDVDLGNSSNGTGIANIDGVGSNWSVTGNLLVGDGGTGDINVTGGGLVQSNGGDVGFGNNSTGTVDVSGPGSFWNAAASGTNLLRVGNLGEGRLNVNSGGRVDASGLRVGDGSGSTAAASVIIDGNGSIVNIAGSTSVGVTHAASLTLSGGGLLNTGSDGSSPFIIDQALGSLGDSVVDIEGPGSHWNHQGSGGITVARNNSGSAATPSRINVTAEGQVTTPRLDIAFFGPSHGLVTVDGAGSRIDVADEIQIGAQGTGSLLVQGGGVVAAQNKVIVSGFRATGAATVTGLGSHLTAGTTLGVAERHPNTFNGFSTGTLDILDGGTVTNLGNGLLARQGVNRATVNVGDGNRTATWNNGDSLLVGGSGSATLNVNASGVVNVVNTLSVSSTSTVNLLGGEINVGTLDIADPNDFNFNTGTLRLTGNEAFDAAAYAKLFQGVGSPMLGANQHLAVTGEATLAAPIALNHATAALSVGSATDLSNVAWNAGTLSFTNQNLAIGSGGLLGGFVTVNSDQALGVPNNAITVESLANLNVTGGGLRTSGAVNDGRIFISGSTDIDFDADQSGAGLTNHEDLVFRDASVSGEIVNLGAFDVAGDVALADSLVLGNVGTIEFLIAGTLSGEFGALAVAGDVDLAGDLEVSLTGGFAPAEGDKFRIIDVIGTRAGTFNGLVDSGLVGTFGGIDLFIDYDAGDGNDVELFTVSASDADLDNDNDVDGADFLAIQRTTPGLISNWKSQYGNGSPLTASFSSVPEPATCLLCLGGIVLAALNRPKDFANENRTFQSSQRTSYALPGRTAACTLTHWQSLDSVRFDDATLNSTWWRHRGAGSAGGRHDRGRRGDTPF